MEQLELVARVVGVLESLGVPYALVGSWGSGLYGEPRFTRDVDIVLDLPAAAIPAFCQSFPTSDYYLDRQAVEDAVRSRFQFNVIHPASGNKIDFILPRDNPWNAGQLSRRRSFTLQSGERTFTVCVASPEDVIIGKLWYYDEGGGDRHLRDIAGILRVTGEGVNRAEVERWARELGYLEIWNAIVTKADSPDESPGPGSP